MTYDILPVICHRNRLRDVCAYVQSAVIHRHSYRNLTKTVYDITIKFTSNTVKLIFSNNVIAQVKVE